MRCQTLAPASNFAGLSSVSLSILLARTYRLQVALAIDARLEQVKVIRNSRGRCTYDDRVVRLPSRDSC